MAGAESTNGKIIRLFKSGTEIGSIAQEIGMPTDNVIHVIESRIPDWRDYKPTKEDIKAVPAKPESKGIFPIAALRNLKKPKVQLDMGKDGFISEQTKVIAEMLAKGQSPEMIASMMNVSLSDIKAVDEMKETHFKKLFLTYPEEAHRLGQSYNNVKPKAPLYHTSGKMDSVKIPADAKLAKEDVTETLLTSRINHTIESKNPETDSNKELQEDIDSEEDQVEQTDDSIDDSQEFVDNIENPEINQDVAESEESINGNIGEDVNNNEDAPNVDMSDDVDAEEVKSEISDENIGQDDADESPTEIDEQESQAINIDNDRDIIKINSELKENIEADDEQDDNTKEEEVLLENPSEDPSKTSAFIKLEAFIKSQIESNKTTIESIDSKIESLNNKINEKWNILKQYETEYNDLRNKITEIKAKFDEEKKSFDALKDSCEELESKKRSIVTELEQFGEMLMP